MKKNTKKKILILVMSVALVVANFAVFSMVDSGKVGETGKATSALADSSDDTEQKASSQTAAEKKDERKSIKAVLGTEENLEAVNDKLQIIDGTGEELELTDLGKDEYDGFIYKLAEPTETELAVMAEAADELPKDAEVDAVVEGSTYVADSLETISKVAAAGKLEYVEPNYKATLAIEDGVANVEEAETDIESTKAVQRSNEGSEDENESNPEVSEETSVDLKTEDNIEICKENAELNKTGYIPNDYYYGRGKWYQEMVRLPQVWAEGVFGSSSVTVAVIDSGVYSSHEDLEKCTIKDGWTYLKDRGLDGAKGSEDEYWHGTFVAGIIAADFDNKIGTAGAMHNVTILPLKVFGKETIEGGKKKAEGGSLSDIEKAINKATEENVDVINMSLDFYGYSKSMDEACQKAINKGIIVVCSAGNDATDKASYPANYDNVVGVGSIGKEKARSIFSNYNSASTNSVDVVAPGENIYGPIVPYKDKDKTGNEIVYKYCVSQGTSFSAPIVSALAAMTKSIDEEITAQDFNVLLKDTSETIGSYCFYGNGRADFEAANYCLHGANSIRNCETLVDVVGVIYDGKEHSAEITIVDPEAEGGPKTLVKDKDFELEGWANNRDVGTATCVIRGINDYFGYTTATFKIEPRDISEKIAQTVVSSCVYNGYGQQPGVSVSGLTSGKDFVVSYRNNVEATNSAIVVVTGTGNYKGRFEKSFAIEKADVANYGAVGGATYTGGGVYPGVYNMGGLRSGSDYSVSYSNNVNVGYGYVTVYASGNNTYGSKTMAFPIGPKGTSIKKPGRAKKAITVKWSKQKSKMPKPRIKGYQIQVARDPGFTWDVRTKNVSGYRKSSKKVSGLARKTTYYTRVRTYMNTAYGVIYSDWSGVSAATTK